MVHSQESKGQEGNTKKAKDEEQHIAGEIVVNYDSTKHFKIITQMRGSIWPRVLPFCIVNTLLMFVCDYWLVDLFGDANVNVSGKAHGWIRIMVSFMVITRMSNAMSRYDKAGANLQKILCGTRDLVSYVVSVSCMHIAYLMVALDSYRRHCGSTLFRRFNQ